MILTPAKGTSFLLLDQQPAVFCAATQKLYALNEVAALIWCCLEQREPSSIIVDRLVTSGVKPAEAERYIRRALHRWLRLGLVQVDIESFNELAIASSFNVSLGRLTWMFQVSSDRLAQLLLQLFFCHKAPWDTGKRVKIVEVDGRVYVFANDQHVLTGAMDNIIPAIKAYLTQQLMMQSAPDIALHAACLRYDAKALLISGGPGAGKTTLALHLVQHGLQYCTDDIVFVAQDGAVTGTAFAPTIKSGAWRMLEQIYPRLATAPVHRRPDGKLVKYFNALPNASNGGVSTAGWIIFLKRRPRGAAKLEPLGQLDVLKRLIKSSFSSHGRMSLPGLTSMKTLITQSESFELTYRHATEATHAILALCNARS